MTLRVAIAPSARWRVKRTTLHGRAAFAVAARAAARDLAAPSRTDRGCVSTRPGVSSRVESISIQPSRAARRDERRAAHVADLGDLLAGREPVRDLDDLPLGVAVHEQVGARVEQRSSGAPFRPVVVVRDAAQARLDAADHDRHVGERLAHALRVDDHAAIGPLAADAVGRVRVVAAHAPVRRVAVDHRVHVAGR